MILDEIIKNKQQEVSVLKENFKDKDIEQLIVGLPKSRDFLKAFSKGKFSLIAEIKKSSPSAGLIRKDFEPISLAKVYEESGASAISVLTDEKYFQGKLEYIKQAKESTTIPVLRKEFIVDEAQVYESKIAGADAVLLIARILKDDELINLLALTEKLGMQALVEVHNADEVQRVLKTNARIIGINNRDLDTLKISLKTTINLLKQFPGLKDRVVISESGIQNKKDVQMLRDVGVDGMLVGEAILKSASVPDKIRELLR